MWNEWVKCKFYLGSMKESDGLEAIGVGGRIILKCM